jgi:O-antigen/teichoic acid export membrane protein
VHEVSDALPVTTRDDEGRGRVARKKLHHLFESLRRHNREETEFVVSNAIVNVANFGFFVVVSRLFSTSSYGAITALLSIVTVANTPLNAIQAGVVHATVVIRQSLGSESPRRVVAAFAGVGLAVTMVIAAASILVERFFTLPNVFPVLMLALWFAPSVVSSALCGSLMGHFKFRAIAVANVVGALTRIGLAVAFGAAGHLFGLSGPIIATSAGVAVSTTWIFVAVRKESNWRTGAPLELHLSHTLWAFISLGGFASFVAIDVVLARHLLAASIAGSYAAASTAGKIALFLSVAVPIVAYPRFAKHHAAGTDGRRDLLYSLEIVVGLGILAAGVMALFPHVIVLLLFGHRYASAAPILRLLAPEGAVMGVVGLFTYYHVAQRSFWAILPWFGVLAVTLATTIGNLSAHDLAVLMLISATIVSVLMAIPELPSEWVHRLLRNERKTQLPTR